MSETELISANDEDKGMRLDVFLCQKYPDQSRSQIAAWIKEGLVCLGDKKLIKASYKINGDENFVIRQKTCQAWASLEPQNIPLDFLYNDEHLAVINKPAALVVHPGAGIKDGTLCNALLHHFPQLKNSNQERPGLVHRLDKDTSGAILVAKNELSLRRLSEAFKERQVKKTYRAWACGEILEDFLELKTGHARHPFNPLRFFTNLPVPKSVGPVRLAHSSVRVLHRKFGISAISVELHTGRTHQIRAHLADINHPLLKDALYGGNRALGKNITTDLQDLINQINGQALHAETLEFIHPNTKKPMIVKAPLPKLYEMLDEKLR